MRNEAPWSMIFVDDIVLVRESREEIEQNLERWRNSLERNESEQEQDQILMCK